MKEPNYEYIITSTTYFMNTKFVFYIDDHCIIDINIKKRGKRVWNSIIEEYDYQIEEIDTPKEYLDRNMKLFTLHYHIINGDDVELLLILDMDEDHVYVKSPGSIPL